MTLLACFLAAACSGAASVNGPESPEDGASTVSSVQMTPSNVAVHVGGTTNLSLEVETSDGEPLDREGEWTVRDPSVVAVKGQGAQRQAEGRSEGVTHVIGTVDGVADSAEVKVGDQAGPSDATVASVELSPSDVTVSEGSSAQVSLTVTSADGASLDRSGSWKVDDSSVVSVDGSGSTRQVAGLAIGSARVIVTVDGIADTTAVEVTEASSPADAEPAVVFDPDRYASTQELEDDPFGVFSDVEIGGRYFLDKDVAHPDGSQSMRYDYVDQGATEQNVGRRMPLPERVREVWVEAEVRWSENFFADAVLDDEKTTFSHKLLFAQAQATSTSPNWETSDGQKVSRWPLLWPMGGSGNPPNASIGVASPRRVDGKVGTADPLGRIGVNAADYFDGEWHTIRMHLRHDPGLYWLEIDGRVVADISGFTIHPEVNIPAILVGRNKVTGNATGTESLWWGEISVWTQDPGW